MRTLRNQSTSSNITRQALRVTDSSEMLTPYPGEQNGLYYIPLGVGVVIAVELPQRDRDGHGRALRW